MWISAELAAQRVPHLRIIATEPMRAPTLGEASESWRASRIDVDEGTRRNDAVNTDRVFKYDPSLAERCIDEIGTEEWAGVFATLASKYKRGTLKKSREAFAMLYDHFTIDPNQVRAKTGEASAPQKADLIMPLAVQVEAVAAVLPRHQLLPYLINRLDRPTGRRARGSQGARPRRASPSVPRPGLDREEREAGLARA